MKTIPLHPGNSRPNRFRPALLRGLALLAALLALTGCVSTKYKMAPKDTPPPVAFHLTAAQPPVEAVLHSAIVFQGPGSWKREAYWDEYVLSIANRGETPFTVETATLVDFQGNPNGPGENPWKLEDQSKTWWQKVRSSQTGNLLALGAGAVGLSGGLTLVAIGSSGFLGPATATSTAAVGAATAVLVVAPIYAVTVVVINSNNKKHVLAEFARRRLALPLTLVPGQVAQGSLFFRISPGPQRLLLHCRVGDQPRDVAIDLAPLAGLHLKNSSAGSAVVAPPPPEAIVPPGK